MAGWADFFPDAAYAGAFGTGTPQEEATRAPTPVDNAVRAAGNAFALPGKVLQSQTPMTSDQMVGPATDLASFVTLGSGAMPSEANALRMGIKAYHGSPYDFDRFDMSKIGTGEGAQAYGHGLYFAGHEGTAKSYRDALAPGHEIHMNGEPVDWRHANEPYGKAYSELASAGSFDAARSSLAQRTEKTRNWHSENGYGEPDLSYFKQISSALDDLEREGVSVGPPAGKMYEVDINADPAHFLDWDKPLSEQSGAVKAALLKSGLPEEYLQSKVVMGQGLAPNGPEYAAQLRDAGIPGIKYLDQGSRNQAMLHIEPHEFLDGSQGFKVNGPKGDMTFDTKQEAQDYINSIDKGATSNYVVFNDKLIDILRKYGWAGIAALPALQSREERT